MAALLVGLLHSPGTCVCGCAGVWVCGCVGVWVFVGGWVVGG